jgi:hypothetical protein
MSDPFVPFVKSRSKPGSASDSFRLTILPQAQPAALFQPTAPSPPPPTTTLPPKEPQVTIERDGDRITRIQIQCVCGQLLELNCSY